jgi:hypothetical protein
VCREFLKEHLHIGTRACELEVTAVTVTVTPAPGLTVTSTT